ncbi:MAG: RagB/SusD family nutrient uptake outer membrane protein [Flavobacteriaceae bacterium]
MKNIKTLYVALSVAVTLIACEKDFLETRPTELVSAEDIQEASVLNPGLQAANVGGIYATMYQAGSGGTSGHDDFGHKGYDIYGDMLSGDMVLGAIIYGWYRSITEFQTTTDFTFTDNYQVWRFYYRVIFAANIVIDGLTSEDQPVPANADGRHYLGQAKAMRAWAYFYLAQYFQENPGNQSEEILPIYTNTQDPNQGLSSASDVYDLIFSDLEDSTAGAITLLSDFTRSAKSEVDVNIARGIAAYAHGARGTADDWTAVRTLTDAILADVGGNLMTASEVVYDSATGTGGGFNDASIPGWMWGVDLTNDSDLGLISWWGVMDVFTYSYAWAGDGKSIDLGLHAQIAANDVRLGQFQGDIYGRPGMFLPYGKFFHPNRTIGGQRAIDADYVYMRVAEMHLLNAEARANTGDDAGAQQKLTQLITARTSDGTDPYNVGALSGQALKDAIYLQTRIELWGEGKSYLAMKRNRATITRGSNHLSFAGDQFSFDDDKLTFEIPELEILNNPEISN